VTNQDEPGEDKRLRAGFDSKQKRRLKDSRSWSNNTDIEGKVKAHGTDFKRDDKSQRSKPLPPPDPGDENRESRISAPSDDCT